MASGARKNQLLAKPWQTAHQVTEQLQPRWCCAELPCQSGRTLGRILAMRRLIDLQLLMTHFDNLFSMS